MCQHWLQNVLLLIACGPVLKSAGKLGPVTLLAFDWEPPRDNSWVVGKPEVILGLDLFAGQAVNALLFWVGYRKLTHHPGRYLIDIKIASRV